MHRRTASEEAKKQLAEMLMNVPEPQTILELIEDVYLRLAGRYGEPVIVGNVEIWGFKGIFEELNSELMRRGYRALTWQEFVEYLHELEKYYAKVYVSFIVSPKGTIEPHDITFFEPVFKHRVSNR